MAVRIIPLVNDQDIDINRGDKCSLRYTLYDKATTPLPLDLGLFHVVALALDPVTGATLQQWSSQAVPATVNKLADGVIEILISAEMSSAWTWDFAEFTVRVTRIADITDTDSPVRNAGMSVWG